MAAALPLAFLVVRNQGIAPVALAAVPALVLIAKVMGLYDRDEHLVHKTTIDEFPGLFHLATLMALLVPLMVAGFTPNHTYMPQILALWAGVFTFLALGRATARQLALRLVRPERCLLVGDEDAAALIRHKLETSPSIKAELVEVLPIEATHMNGDVAGEKVLPALLPLLAGHEIDRVILAPGTSGTDELLHVIKALKGFEVKVSVLPGISQVAGASVELDHIDGITLLGMRRFEMGRSSRLLKRAFDIVGGTALLLAFAPVLAVAAIAIKRGSPGPVFFRQRRVGREGEVFEILKFRTMVADADARKDEVRHLNQGLEGLFKIPDDPRVTRVGAFLRRYSLDELPQIFHVLSGRMSLVGPRPLIPEEDGQIRGWQRGRLEAPPGITGHWQILGSSRVPLQEMAKLDFQYVANWSLWSDVRILLQTLSFVLSRRGV